MIYNNTNSIPLCWLVCLVFSAFALYACQENGSYTESGVNVSVQADPIALASVRGCQIDSDCSADRFCFQSQCVRQCDQNQDCGEGASCSSRGRCVDEQRAAERREKQVDDEPLFIDDDEIGAVSTAQGEIGITQGLPDVINVEPGQTSVTLPIVTKKDVPQGKILYRVELENQPPDERVYTAEGTDHFELTIPTGVASGQDKDVLNNIQFAYVITSVGAFNVTMRPKVRDTGLYEGEVVMETFGVGGLPIQMGIRLTPSDADFEHAEKRELLLPVRGSALFSPKFSASLQDHEWIARPIEYDEVGRVWVARYANHFILNPLMLFGQREDIVRTLRFEISKIEDRVVYGAIADRWEGLYAERSADGVTQMAPMRLSGRFEAHRVGRLSAQANEAVLGESSYPSPPIPPPAEPDACTQEVWGALYDRIVATFEAQKSEEDDDDDVICYGLDQLENLPLANSQNRAKCVEEGARIALSGQTTSRIIRAFMDPQADNPGGLSFDAFLQRCAAQDGYCVPTDEILCMNQLVAMAYQRYDYNDASDASEADEDVAKLLDFYQQLSRETYLGMELAAYQRDTQTRLDWLRTAIAPLFLAAELRSYNDDIMVKWERDVLGAHYKAMARQYGPADLEVLARVPNSAAAQSARRALLLELTQTWQGTMDALVLASQRWNELYQSDTKRANASAKIQRRMLELYLSAGVLSQLNASAGSGVANAQFGSGFSNLSTSLDKLNKSFNDLIFYRDAEVVVSHSVDPQQDARTLLKDKESLARQAIADAQSTVDRVLNDAHQDELDEALLKDQMQTQIDALRAELVNLCGIPKGCKVQDVGVEPGCDIPTDAGSCGTGYPMREVSFETIGQEQLLASDAGKAILDIQSSFVEIESIDEEFRAAGERMRIQMENAKAFEANLNRWRSRRQQINAEIASTLNDISRLKDSKLQKNAQYIGQMQQRRLEAYNQQADNVEKWAQLEIDGNQEDYEDMQSINTKRMRAMYLDVSASTAEGLADAIAEGFDSPAKAIIKTISTVASAGLSYGAVSQEHRANELEAQLANQQAVRDSKVRHLQSLAELDAQLSQNKIQDLADDIRLLELDTDAEISAREALIDGLRRSVEADIAYENDLQELRERQSLVQEALIEQSAIAPQYTQAELSLDQRVLAYDTIVQRAQLLEGRFHALNARAQNLEQMMGSPAVIFAFANRLASADSRLERAKTLLFDWLVALEYYAVRPFADQRIAVTLARNPSQLEAIANDLLRLTRVCGGMVNYETVDVSVRDQFLRMDRAVNVSLEGEQERILAPAERFRALLARGNIPLNTQTRYTADERVGDLINNRKVLALSFPIRLTDFANLPQTCNAKVASVAVQLVGSGLNDSLLPVVSVLYDGTSELISCQPNIEELVGVLDPGATAFGLITRFRTAGRSVSPVARVNAYGPDDTDNRGLEGLPLSSNYTLLIDPAKGDNRSIDWDELEDIRLKITYAYQDVFPEDQCQ